MVPPMKPRKHIMTKSRTRVSTKSLATVLPLMAMLAMNSAVVAMEPVRDPGRIDLRRPDILLTQIVWQDRSELGTSRNRFQAAYIGALEQRYGRPGGVSRSNLLNSPAARYFTRVLTGRRGR